jgi:RES domain-containing protein
MGLTADACPVTRLNWNPAYRVIPTRFPAINLFDRVASAADFDALYALESLTNDRLRDELGEIALVPPAQRLFGPGSGPIMAAFTHPNPLGSRFSDGSYGVFYCARESETAVAETAHHAARFLAATRERPMRLQMRLYAVKAKGQVADLRPVADADPAILDPDDYRHSQALGRQLRDAGPQGLAYPSVRRPKGECLAAFRPKLLSHCVHSAYLEFHWNGDGIEAVFQLSRLA